MKLPVDRSYTNPNRNIGECLGDWLVFRNLPNICLTKAEVLR